MPSVAPPDLGIQLHNRTSITYQRTLPYVRAHDADNQWDLWGDGAPAGPMALADALAPAAELVAALEVDPRQLQLFSHNGVRRDAPFRRDSAGGPAAHRSWAELDHAIAMRTRYSRRRWTDGDQRTLDDLYAQTFAAADVRRVFTTQAWVSDVMVCPLSGELVRFPKPWACRRILDVLFAAFDSGAGGVLMSHDAWAAELRCSVRSVTTYVKALVGIGAVAQFWPRRPNPGEKGGTCNGHKLYRLGPLYERYAAVLTASRRRRSSGAVREAGRMLAAQLQLRAARRRFDLEGALYRGRHGRAVSTREGDGRTRGGVRPAIDVSRPEGVPSCRPPEGGPCSRSPSTRQSTLHSPPLPGLHEHGPPSGGRQEGTPSGRETSIAGRTPPPPTPTGAHLKPPRSESVRDVVALEGESFSPAIASLARGLAAALE